jgi:DNA-binding MarR family transcriptional regulator
MRESHGIDGTAFVAIREDLRVNGADEGTFFILNLEFKKGGCSLMLNEINEMSRKVLEFLYWEGQIDPNYFIVDKIRDETDLTDANVQDGLNLLHEDGFVECNIGEKDVRIIEAKLTMRGIDEAKSRLDI